MDEPEQHKTPSPDAPPTSLAGRLLNVFAAPGEVFAQLGKNAPMTENWVAPLVLVIISGIVYCMVVFSQPAVFQRMKELQETQLQQRVADGKMTQNLADRIEELMTPSYLRLMGILGSLISNPAGLFLTALIVWMVGMFGLRANLSYMRAVEICGLAMMILALGAVVSMLLAVIYGNVTMTPSLVLLLGHSDPSKRLDHLLASLNVMTLWYLAVLSLALAKTTGKSFTRAAAWLYGLWAAFVAIGVLLFAGR